MDMTIEPAPLQADTWFYYGAYRQGREKMFSWVDDQVPAWDVSSTSAKFDDFERIQRVPPMSRDNFFPTLRSYGMGIYMQDAKSAARSHSPATRFYEMLSAGLPMAFTPDCVPTLAQYDIDVSNYIITRDLMDYRDSVANVQRADWYRDYPADLALQVKHLAKGIGL
jgi:hypothetical protein